MDGWLTLLAVRDHGTTSRAAQALRITQSAVSKRLDRFANELGIALVERQGRRIALTPEAERLLEEAEPLWRQLQSALQPRGGHRPVRVAASESLLTSWLPERILRAGACELHAHRGVGVLERVRSGAVELAICADAGPETGLESRWLRDEQMGIVTTEEAFPLDEPRSLWGIEPQALTAQAIERKLTRLYPQLRVESRLESYAPLVQLAKAGFGPALVPEGVALAMHAPFFPVPGLVRQIVGVARPTSWNKASVNVWWERLKEA